VIKLPKKSGIRYINLEKIKCLVCKKPNPNWEAWLKIMNVKDRGSVKWINMKLHFCNTHYQQWKSNKIEINSADGKKIKHDLPGWTILHCNVCNNNKVDYMYKGEFQDLYICKPCAKYNNSKKLEFMVLFANSVKDSECDIFAFSGFILDEIIRTNKYEWIEDYKLKHAVKSVLILYGQYNREVNLILGE